MIHKSCLMFVFRLDWDISEARTCLPVGELFGTTKRTDEFIHQRIGIVALDGYLVRFPILDKKVEGSVFNGRILRKKFRLIALDCTCAKLLANLWLFQLSGLRLCFLRCGIEWSFSGDKVYGLRGDADFSKLTGPSWFILGVEKIPDLNSLSQFNELDFLTKCFFCCI